VKPTVRDLEQTLLDVYPDEESFPLLRTLHAASSELGVPARVLVRTLKNPGQTLWRRGDKVYVPPDVFERWRRKLAV
jgi:hypothetical protein